jgi:hypothetical protein
MGEKLKRWLGHLSYRLSHAALLVGLLLVLATLMYRNRSTLEMPVSFRDVPTVWDNGDTFKKYPVWQAVDMERTLVVEADCSFCIIQPYIKLMLDGEWDFKKVRDGDQVTRYGTLECVGCATEKPSGVLLCTFRATDHIGWPWKWQCRHKQNGVELIFDNGQKWTPADEDMANKRRTQAKELLESMPKSGY